MGTEGKGVGRKGKSRKRILVGTQDALPSLPGVPPLKWEVELMASKLLPNLIMADSKDNPN